MTNRRMAHLKKVNPRGHFERVFFLGWGLGGCWLGLLLWEWNDQFHIHIEYLRVLFSVSQFKFIYLFFPDSEQLITECQDENKSFTWIGDKIVILRCFFCFKYICAKLTLVNIRARCSTVFGIMVRICSPEKNEPFLPQICWSFPFHERCTVSIYIFEYKYIYLNIIYFDWLNQIKAIFWATISYMLHFINLFRSNDNWYASQKKKCIYIVYHKHSP